MAIALLTSILRRAEFSAPRPGSTRLLCEILVEKVMTLSGSSLFMLACLAPSMVLAQDTCELTSYHFQFTGIQQTHARFEAKYSGRNSLLSASENRFSVTATLFLGHRLWEGTEVYCNPEMQGGSGFSSTRDVAGFPNGEVYRVDDPKPKVSIARMFLRQQIPLGEEEEWVRSDQNQLAGYTSASRLTITLGRICLTDGFDDNSYSHDPRTQFMNWSLWAGGAWDYAADTRGYDWGIVAQLIQSSYAVNFAAVMVPTEANGPFFDQHISKAYSLNLELVKPYSIFISLAKLHVVAFLNHAHMGNYRAAIDRGNELGDHLTLTKQIPILRSMGVCFPWNKL